VAFDEAQRIPHSRLMSEFICAAACGSATAHSVDTDLTGEKVR
jgi:hypothetical protein